MANLTRNIPLSIDDELLAAVDSLAADKKESRSAIMRSSIREGLPLVKSGGGADVLSLDSELSHDANEASRITGVSRNKILLEAIRVGLQAVYWQLEREKIIHAQDNSPDEAAIMVEEMNRHLMRDDPMSRQVRAALVDRGTLKIRLDDLLEHVPEAKRRQNAIERLTEIRRTPGGGGGGPAWRSGLSTEEMEWQIGMTDKYGANAADWPEDEKKAHYAAQRSKK